MPTKPIYVVTMYRYGDREKHSYVLGLYDSEKRARDIAKIEQAYRGGNKYYPEILSYEINKGASRKTILKLEE